MADQVKVIRKRGYFAKAHKPFIRDVGRVGHGAFRLWCELASTEYEHGDAVPTQGELAQTFDCTPQCIRDWLRQLEGANWLIAQACFDERGFQVANLYICFEDTEDCLEYRRANNLPDPEPAPTPKSRKGVGGRKPNSAGGNSSFAPAQGETQVSPGGNSSFEHITESESDLKTQGSLKESVRESDSAPTPVGAQGAAASQSKDPVPEESPKAKNARKPYTKDEDPLYDKLCTAYELNPAIVYDSEKEYKYFQQLKALMITQEVIYRTGNKKSTKDFREQCAKDLAESLLSAWVRWYGKECPKCSLPYNRDSFSRYMIQWYTLRAQRREREQGQQVQETKNATQNPVAASPTAREWKIVDGKLVRPW